jgi:aminoglycoside/choline kinase family phosphotransferase
MDSRQQALQKWLRDTCQLAEPVLQILPSDASFRRYFRVPAPAVSYIAMDAPPAKENCVPYIAIANALRAHGLLTPEIIASDLREGFLLLTDFGDRLLLKELNIHTVELFYKKALDALVTLQSCCHVRDWQIHPFTVKVMYQELILFKEWFLQNHLNLVLPDSIHRMLENFFYFLVNSAASQPQVFMHRDYHSANLMVLPSHQIGILDFQDAFIGPVTYDLVSLLRDCYIAWPEELVTKYAIQYREQLTIAVSNDEFLRWFDLMGLQRHLKALLTFARKYRRDGNAHYLQHIPRTLSYITAMSERYLECKAFYHYLQAVILPAYKESTACME